MFLGRSSRAQSFTTPMNREQMVQIADGRPISRRGLFWMGKLPSWTWVFVGLLFLVHSTEPGRSETDEYAGTNLLAGANYLQTGSGSPLVRSNLSWSAPIRFTHPALVFAVGFATQEGVVPGEFFDSLTVTLRDSSNSLVAPILTVDALGSVLSPENPGGGQLRRSGIESESLTYPPTHGDFAVRQAWLVMVVLPSQLAGQSGTLRLSLFDNQDSEASVGFVSHLSVVPGPGTAIAVESSTKIDGGYAVEGITVRHARRRITMPPPGAHRFFRLEAPMATTMTSLRVDAGDLIFRYAGGVEGVAPRLLSSAQVAGPYALEHGVIADVSNRTLRRSATGAARFFRLNAEIPLTIRSLSFDADGLVLRYE